MSSYCLRKSSNEQITSSVFTLDFLCFSTRQIQSQPLGGAEVSVERLCTYLSQCGPWIQQIVLMIFHVLHFHVCHLGYIWNISLNKVILLYHVTCLSLCRAMSSWTGSHQRAIVTTSCWDHAALHSVRWGLQICKTHNHQHLTLHNVWLPRTNKLCDQCLIQTDNFWTVMLLGPIWILKRQLNMIRDIYRLIKLIYREKHLISRTLHSVFYWSICIWKHVRPSRSTSCQRNSFVGY